MEEIEERESSKNFESSSRVVFDNFSNDFGRERKKQKREKSMENFWKKNDGEGEEEESKKRVSDSSFSCFCSVWEREEEEEKLERKK